MKPVRKPIRRTRALIVGGALATLAITSAVLSRSQGKARIAIYPAAQAVSSGATTADASQDVDRRSLAFYLGNTSTDLFTEPQPNTSTSPPGAAHPGVPLPAPPVVKTVPVEQSARWPPQPDRFAAYVYSGTVTVDGQMVALIEDSRSKGGWYIRSGDRFQGASVTSIDAQSVALDVDGKPRLLVKSDDFNAVPLNASAKTDQTDKAAQAAAGQPGSAGAVQTASVQPGNAGSDQTASDQPGNGRRNRFGGPGGPFGGPGGPGGFGGPGGPGGFGGPGGPGGFGGPGGPPPR